MIRLFTTRYFTYTLPIILMSFLSVNLYVEETKAQADTLLFENFNAPFDYAVDDSDGVASEPNGSNQTWVNYDEDGLASYGGVPGSWFWKNSSYHSEDESHGGAMVSRSWLDNFLPGNRNWLITPPIYIADNQAVLSWKSAPAQGPRYMDGYSVLVSTGSNNPHAIPYPFEHEIFRAAFMTAITGDPLSTDLDNYAFSPGYIHADGFTLPDFFVHADNVNNFDQHLGLLEPHTVSLAQFAGQTIYIAFLHNSDDCFDLVLDDILVTGNFTVSTNDMHTDVSIEIFPNPAASYINIQYQASNVNKVEARVYTADGKLATYYNDMPASEGRQHYEANLKDLPAGQYTLQMYFDGIATRAKSFIVK